MDCQLPEMDGVAATRLIRAHEANRPRLPILALTACATPADRDDCLNAGMDDYLTKPVHVDQLLSVLANWMHARPALTLSGSPLRGKATIVNVPAALGRVQGRMLFLRQLARRFIEAIPASLEALQRALAASDLASAAAQAHRLRGEASTFDALRLMACAAKLEAAARAQDAPRAARLLRRLEWEAERLTGALHEDLVGCS